MNGTENMVKLTVKTIKGKKFQIEVEQTQTVSGNGLSSHVCLLAFQGLVCTCNVSVLACRSALHGVTPWKTLEFFFMLKAEYCFSLPSSLFCSWHRSAR